MEVENKFKYNKDDFIKCETNINNNNNCLFISFCNLLGINTCFSKLMRLLIQDTLKNMYKLDEKNKKDILKHANNISDENFKGNHYDIEAFSLLTGFNIILLNYDYTVDNNINIVKNDNSTIVYLIQNENKNHIDALIPKNNCLYINYEFYKTIAKTINDKIICKYNENNNLNDKIINNSMLDNNSKSKFKNQKEDKNRKDLKIDDNVNKTVAENIKCKNIY